MIGLEPVDNHFGVVASGRRTTACWRGSKSSSAAPRQRCLFKGRNACDHGVGRQGVECGALLVQVRMPEVDRDCVDDQERDRGELGGEWRRTRLGGRRRLRLVRVGPVTRCNDERDRDNKYSATHSVLTPRARTRDGNLFKKPISSSRTNRDAPAIRSVFANHCFARQPYVLLRTSRRVAPVLTRDQTDTDPRARSAVNDDALWTSLTAVSGLRSVL